MPSDFADAYGLHAPMTQQDPYPVYARLRREAPLYWCDAWNAWVLTRHEDVQAAFRDPRWSADRASAFAGRVDAATRERFASLFANLRGWALFMDAPAPTRVRALLSRAFSPKLVAELRPKIEQLVAGLLSDAGAAVDVVSAVAVPLPVLVIGRMLGLPREDAPRLKRWSDELAALLGAGRPTPQLIETAARAVGEIESYFRAHLDERRRAPRHDLLTALLTAEEDGALLDEQELLSTCAMILFGGHETTTHLIGNALYALARHPPEWVRLAANPLLAASAVEELLRFDSPVQRIGRIAREPIEMHDARVDAGQRALLMMGAANRDPAAFEEPDRLDIGRAAGKHLALGHGAHYCVGAALGRLEAEVAIMALVRRFPDGARVIEPPRYMDNQTIRGLESLILR